MFHDKYLDIGKNVSILFTTDAPFCKTPTVRNVVTKVIQIKFARAVAMDNRGIGLETRVEYARFSGVEIQLDVICCL